jgi:hypothetical protein
MNQLPELTDAEFLAQFENCSLPKAYFNHRGHIRMTWIYLRQETVEAAVQHVTEGIKRYAASLGASHIYHETLTRAWVYLVKKAMQASDDNFDKFFSANNSLFEKSLPLQYYSSELLHSERAKKEWVLPDLKPIE